MHEMNPLVSILVPIYNVEKYIENCVRSLFAQTYDSIEYIFINDCSPDDSIGVLQKVLLDYPSRVPQVKIVNNIENKGVSASRNIGIEIACGEFLLFVDSDDHIDLDSVEKLVSTAISNHADIVSYDLRYIYPDKDFIVHQNIKSSPKEYVCQLLTYQVGVTMCGKLIKRSLFMDNGIRFACDINFGEDYMISPMVSYYASRIAHCPSVYYNYIQYNSSSSTNAYRSKNIDDLVRVLELFTAFFSSKEDFSFFKDAIEEAYLHNKVKLLIAICLHYRIVGHRLKEVSELYIEKHNSSSSLSRGYKVLLWMSKHRLYMIMRAYIVWGYRIKQLLKK